MSPWEAVIEVIERLAGTWERLVSVYGGSQCIPQSEVDPIERAITTAYDGWSEDQRRSIWLQTESGTGDEDDEDLDSESFGHFLQCELLDQVLQVLGDDAEGHRRTAAGRKKARRRD